MSGRFSRLFLGMLCIGLFAPLIGRSAILSPTNNQTVGSDTTLISISWEPVPGADTYEIEIRYNGNPFYSSAGHVGTSFEASTVFTPGYYTLTVRGMAGTTPLAWCDPVTIIVERDMYPSGNEKLNAPPVLFRWTRGEADSYRFRLWRYDKTAGAYRRQREDQIAQPASGSPKWKNKGPTLSPGNYRWAVTDNTPSGPGYTSFAYFKIPKPEFLVIDLSGGPTAERYPVTRLSAIPSGGWSLTHKTSRMVLKKIWPGSFLMGSPTNELGRNEYETVQTAAEADRPFYIGLFEVTQRQWELVMGKRPSYFRTDSTYSARPIECVSHDDVRFKTMFLSRLRARSGLVELDLPDEIQWEYACRASTTTALNSGKNLTSKKACPAMDQVGRYKGNAGTNILLSDPPSKGTAIVGSYKPNAWGLYDMHGNVEEMLREVSILPGLDPIVNTRGGSWMSKAMDCRSASSKISWLGFRVPWIGFRLVVNLP